MTTQRMSQYNFFGVMTLLFAAGTVVTVALCRSMAGMDGGMRMPGGWTMSMAWMQMRDQTLVGVGASFLAMWVAMMVAMMIPSLVPMLIRYREVTGTAGPGRLAWLTSLVGTAYFAVWTAIGAVVFAIGFTLSAAEMQYHALSRAVPIIVGVLVLIVGALQLTAWKTRCLACCREHSAPVHEVLPANSASAWRHGVRLGMRCGYCCFGLMLIVIVLGVMDLRLMAIVTAAVSAERLAPNGPQVARAIGCIVVAAGLFLTARAFGMC